MSLGYSIGFIRKIEKLEPELRDIFFDFGAELEKHREESVGRDEFIELRDIVKELAEAQKRTEKRVEELAKALNELAEAQRRTEEVLRSEAQKNKKTREQMGGLSMSFGYVLENEAYKKLPELLARDFGITVEERLTRKYLRDIEGNFIEVNIFGYGEKKENGKAKRITIIGESKAQLSTNDVDKFLRKKMKRLEGLYEDVFMVLVTHMISGPDVEAYAQQKQVNLYYSYDF